MSHNKIAVYVNSLIDWLSAMEQKTKKEAAKYLGVSDRAIERYASAGRLSVYKEKRVVAGKPRLISLYDFDELKKMKALRADPEWKISNPIALSRREMDAKHVPISAKLLLSINEASALSGLTQEYLKEAISKGKLKPRIYEKGQEELIKRTDLDAFIKKL